MSDFKRDLERGAYYEIKALEILKQHKFKKLKRIEGYFKEYDIKAMYKNKKVFIECKYNRYTSYTNKFFIECFKCDYTYAGITATTSDYYILFSYFDYWIIKTDDLKKALEEQLRILHTNKKATREDLTDYIKSNGIYTKYTVGILVSIDIINKYILFKGEHKKRV
jgi:hypothetical protein